MNFRIPLRLLVIASIIASLLKASSGAQVPTTETISQILAERIATQHQKAGIVVGVIDASGRRIVAYGSAGSNSNLPLGGDTIFEIGSATKMFTSLLLADMVQRGEVALDDPVAKYLPAGIKVPERGGRAITLRDLATHTSGLPRLPDNINPRDPANPYADYTISLLYNFLASYKLARDIGSEYEYSNLGAGLLGHALARRAGTDYETLVRNRITEPLGLKSTAITLTPEMITRLARGHDSALNPVSNWDMGTLAGAGGLRSDVNDMLSFLAVALGYTKSSLAPAMAIMLKTRRRTTSATTDIALGWHITSRNGAEIVWHNGGTGGYRCFVGYGAQSRMGVVVLSNMNTDAGVDDLGMHLLDSQVPLIGPVPLRSTVAHRQIEVDPKLYDAYVGAYQLTPRLVFTITRTDNGLFAQLTGQQSLQIFPESAHDFFYTAVDAQITFEEDDKGRCSALVLHQNGRDMRAPRIESGR